MTTDLSQYAGLLGDIKIRIRQAQVKATLAANAEMILMYWDVGRMVLEKQKLEGWGASVIPRLAKDIRNDMPEVKGFSKRNIGRMIALYREYAQAEILPQAVAKLPISENSVDLQQLDAKIPWGHNILPEYALRDINKPIGVPDYELRALPESLQSELPTIEEIEAELQSEVEGSR